MDDLAEKLLKMLVEKIEHQAREIEILEEENHYNRDDADKLRETLAATKSYDGFDLREENEAFRKSIDSMNQRNQKLQYELDEYRRNDPVKKEAADKFMKSEGFVLCQNSHKILAIKQVRDLTSWGLRDSKDFVEDWVADSIAATNKSRNLILLQEIADRFMNDSGLALCQAGNKLQAIKEVRGLTEWPLRDSKDFVEAWLDKAAPKPAVTWCHAGVSDPDNTVSDEDIPF